MSASNAFVFVFMCFLCLSEYVKGDEPKAEPQRSNLQNHRYDESDISKLHNIDPSIVKNSHRPQFFANDDNAAEASNGNRNTLDRIDVNANKNDNGMIFNSDVDVEDDDEEEYKPNNHLQNKQNQIRTVLLRLMERKEQRRKFAEVLPILKVMTPPQRLAMAALISKQITADAKNPGLNLDQVKAMFGNDPNVTSDLMLPILLDIANMVREAKDHIRFRTPKAPQAQLLRRSFSTDEEVDPLESHSMDFSVEARNFDNRKPQAKSLDQTPKSMKIAAKIPSIIKNSNIKVNSDLKVGSEGSDTYSEEEDEDEDVIKGSINTNNPEEIITVIFPMNNVTYTDNVNKSAIIINGTLDEDLPVAEKLRALNRYIDRNGNLVILKRPPWIPDGPKYNTMQQHPFRKAEQSGPTQRRRLPISPMRKVPYVKQNCELFTNSLCLDTIDYPSDAIMGSIRRNQAAMTALLTDFPENSADYSIDGITAKQENKYTPEYYINNMNRREDGSAPSASGFMCPSTVKYARPQKARATSGQWKYIVNTGEHTQTLRLEKCLRPREPCTYLTDNFKSKCVQVYNYHRLLTWDQQNGLHMDIFKVPTCCSCHIEGYSVAFPPHTSRPLESASEHFPGEDLHEVNPYEHIQPSIRHPVSTFPGQDSFSLLGDAHNSIPGSSFNKPGFTDDSGLHDLKHIPISNQFDSINNNFHTDIYQQQSSNVRNVKKPPRVQVNEFGLPSYLEPPTKPALKNQDFQQKFKPGLNNHFKRGAPHNKRPNRRPLRKNTSNTGDDQLVGASSVHENPTIINLESFEDINESVDDEYDRTSPRSTTTPKMSPPAKITIKNVNPTTERNRPKTTPIQYPTSQNKEIPLNRRVNYNYHPIIDFFEETKNDAATDRMDSGPVYLSSEDDWRPMAHPAAFPLKSNTE